MWHKSLFHWLWSPDHCWPAINVSQAINILLRKVLIFKSYKLTRRPSTGNETYNITCWSSNFYCTLAITQIIGLRKYTLNNACLSMVFPKAESEVKVYDGWVVLSENLIARDEEGTGEGGKSHTSLHQKLATQWTTGHFIAWVLGKTYKTYRRIIGLDKQGESFCVLAAGLISQGCFTRCLLPQISFVSGNCSRDAEG